MATWFSTFLLNAFDRGHQRRMARIVAIKSAVRWSMSPRRVWARLPTPSLACTGRRIFRGAVLPDGRKTRQSRGTRTPGGGQSEGIASSDDGRGRALISSLSGGPRPRVPPIVPVEDR
jgi:hypothetical protein